MFLASPIALLWFGSIGALLWLWRLASSRRRITVSSLIPFEHLLRRASRRRTNLVVNILFWMQLASFVGITLALAKPMVMRDRSKLVLAVLDTSASMKATSDGRRIFEHAKRALSERIARKASADEVLLMATSAPGSLLPGPTTDGSALARAISDARASDLGGNLATTVRLGRALLSTQPDEIWVVTDEPSPQPSENGLSVISVGKPLANVAIVGVDARAGFCAKAQSHLLATVQNFSDKTQKIHLVAMHDNRQIAETISELAARSRGSFSLVLPDDERGLIEVKLSAEDDHLDVDNHAWLNLSDQALIPVNLRLSSDKLTKTLSNWLSACSALSYTANTPPAEGPYLLISDKEEGVFSRASSVMFVLASEDMQPIASHWVVLNEHPIGSYFSPIETVVASLNVSKTNGVSGFPVISSFINGRKVPVAVADERDGKRLVYLFFDPTTSGPSAPILTVFFNSLRWLMGSEETIKAGEPIDVKGYSQGMLRVRLPDGTSDLANLTASLARYDATSQAGIYRFGEGRTETVVAVNFFNPLESNLMERSSSWHNLAASEPELLRSRKVPQPLGHPLILAILIALFAEWWIYCTRRHIAHNRQAGKSS